VRLLRGDMKPRSAVSRTSGSTVEAIWKGALSSDQPLESACTCVLIDSTNVTSSRMQEKERKG
jgi:hypothetical protein